MKRIFKAGSSIIYTFDHQQKYTLIHQQKYKLIHQQKYTLSYISRPMQKQHIEIASEQNILHMYKSLYGQHSSKYYGFYNSLLDKIILEEHLMLIPMDDRTATRGHGVFDVIYCKNGKIVNLDEHIARIFVSAKSLSIEPPFGKEEMRQKIIEVIEQIYNKYLEKEGDEKRTIEHLFGVRITISSGYGDLSVVSLNKQSILYIVLFQPYINYEKEKNGVDQFVVKTVQKPKELVHSKTLDYAENALMANESKKKGGYQGIKALENGVLLEASMANIAFIFKKQFATPKFETVLAGTTIKKVLTKVQMLIDEGLLQKISFRDITIQEAIKADEMIVTGGDKIVPVLNFNGNSISKKRGPIAEILQNWYESTQQEGIPISIYSQKK